MKSASYLFLLVACSIVVLGARASAQLVILNKLDIDQAFRQPPAFPTEDLAGRGVSRSDSGVFINPIALTALPPEDGPTNGNDYLLSVDPLSILDFEITAGQRDLKHFKGLHSPDAIAPSHSAMARVGDFSVPFNRRDTEITLRKAHVEYRLKAVEQYLATTSDDEATKQRNASFVRNLITESNGLKCETAFQQMHQIALEFSDPNNIKDLDPLALTAAGIYLTAKEEVYRALSCVEAAIHKFRQSDYPTFWALMAHSLYFHNQNQLQTPIKGSISLDDYAECFYYWLKYDLQLHPEDVPFVGTMIGRFVSIYYTWEPDKCEAMIGVISEDEDIPEYFRLLFEASVRVQQAETARGAGYASQVSPANMRIFEERTKEAISILERAWSLNQSWVMPAKQIQESYYRTGDSNAAEHWFDEGLKVQYDCWDLHSIQLRYRMPRWGGSVEEMIDYGLKCYDESRFDTHVPFVLIDAVMIAIAETPNVTFTDNPVLQKYTGLSQKCIDCFNRLLENYATSQTEFGPMWFKTANVLTAYNLEDFAAARKTLDSMEGHWEPRVLTEWRPTGRGWPEIRGIVYARSGAAGNLVKSILRMDQNKFAVSEKMRTEVATILDEALSKTDHPIEKEFWDRKKMIFDCQCDYRDGKPVKLGFEPNRNFWTGYGSCRVEGKPDSVIFDNSIADYTYSFHTPAFFAGPKIIDFEYERLENKNNPRNGSHPIFFRHVATVDFDSDLTHATTAIEPEQNQLFVLIGAHFPPYRYQLPISAGPKYHVRLYCADKYLEVHVSGQLTARMRHDNIYVGDELFVRNNAYFSGQGKAFFGNIQVRKWMEGPPPDEADTEALLEYYHDSSENRPEDGSWWFNLGVLEHHQKNYDEAELALAKATETGVPVDFVSFYRGDIEERRGKVEKAVELYRQSVCSSTWHTPNIEGYPRPFISPREWAAFRCRWLLATLDPPPTIDDADLEKINAAEIAPPNPWMGDLLTACEAAHRSDFPAAVRAAISARDVAPAEFRERISRQIESYELGRAYVLPADEKWYYLEVEPSLFWPIADETIQREMMKLRLRH